MKLRIPATSANLGCGYDTLGLALDLYNEYVIETGAQDALIGEDRELATHMVFGARNLACEILGLEKVPFRLQVAAAIPESRGLGSSAACILAGVCAALALNGRPLEDAVVLETASRIEGHPDNIVPAWTGALTASLDTGTRILHHRIEPHPDLVYLTIIPPFEFSTAGARSAIPVMIRHRDAVSNLSRVILLTEALRLGQTDQLPELLHDELHQKYRLPLIRQLDEAYGRLWDHCLQQGDPIFLSGAGPTCIIPVRSEQASDLANELSQRIPSCRILTLRAASQGTVVLAE